jgi:primosomal protein N' (replication factor Y)
LSAYFELVFDIPLNQTFTYRADEKSEAAVGKRAMVPFGKRDTLGFIVASRDNPPDGINEIKIIRRLVDIQPIFNENDIDIARWMAGFYLCGIGQALSAMIPSGRRMIRPALPGSDEVTDASLEISNEQQAALEAITSAQKDKIRPIFYLFGVTGSGKTEVFLRAAEYMIKAGKSVIYLVPEISLTHQTAQVITKRFGPQAATLHSGMSPSTRLSEWMRIRAGLAPIVIGPRSAVFAPLPNLGLIIIDEEHDGSYKSANTPRYHARQIALRRRSHEGVCLLMGSATPSAEAWKLMSEGEITRLNLSRRLAGGGVPEIKTVNLAKTESCLTNELKDEIRKTHQMGRQSILFLNRRGFAYFCHCPDCGWEQTCRRCSVSLTWHKTRGRCVCHYCGYTEAPAKYCPNCGSTQAGYRGFGTEMIEEEVLKTFPDFRVRRVDADTIGKKGSLKETINLFKSGEIDLLLGTQMVAKGLNFPGVRLVGVVFADTGLHLPDFRAAERTFSLIVQVAGRAGRYFPDGKVIVQTLRMEDPAIIRACACDVEGFFNRELQQRKALDFPPYSRLIRFTIRAKDQRRADTAISRLASIARPFIPPNADMLGPAECPIGIINDNYRRQLFLRSKSISAIHSAAREILASYDRGRDTRTYLEVDVDPVSML